jgi:MSHA biogenesis protein MshI
MIRWPWKRLDSNAHLVVSWSGHALAYVHAKQLANGTFEVLKFGVEYQGADNTKDFVSRLNSLGLGLTGLNTHVMLRPEQYQLLQIDAPAVPSKELHSATRYLVKDQLHTNVDSVKLDIMQLGDGEDQKGAGQLFVVAAAHEVLLEVTALAKAMRWNVAAIEIQETAQRSLQSALARQDNPTGGASAALLMVDGQPPILTICANNELFYTQQFDLPEGFFSPPEDHDDDEVDGIDGVDEGFEFADTTGDDNTRRLLLEVQHSLDVWRRSWTNIAMVLDGVRIYAGERSEALSVLFKAHIGEAALPMDVSGLFSGFSGSVDNDKSMCIPLLGTLIQTSSTDPSQKINLFGRTKSKSPKRDYSSAETIFQTLAVLMVLGGCLSTYWVWSLNSDGEYLTKSMAAQVIEIESLNQKKAGGQPSAALDQELQDSRTELLQREKIAKELQRGLLSPGWGHAARLQLIAQSIPAPVWVTKVTSDEAQFEVSGFTLEPAAFGKWVALLAASPLFEGEHLSTVNIDNARTSMQEAVSGALRPTWSFSLVSVMAAPPATTEAKP